jgi:acyl carrier protein
MSDVKEAVNLTSAGGPNELRHELSSLIVEALNLGVAPSEIEPDAPLFGEGLGLDSIDALEIALMIQRKYGVSIAPGEERNKEIFQSLRSLSEFVGTNQKQ